MAVGRSSAVRKHLQVLFTAGAVGDLTDGELLERFVMRRDQGAFEVLVERHGPMVLRVCRGVLADRHDAQDAFQATFLVLVRRAGSVRRRDSVASWLFGVAGRVAARARADAARRRRHEREAAAMSTRSDGGEGEDRPDPGPVLHEEVARLPEKYREAVVLCYLEGHTYEAAARRLRRPVGTIKVRLSRARDLLRGRLARRGLGLPAGLAAAGLVTGSASASVAPTLVLGTVELASRLAAGETAAVASAAAKLADVSLRAMMMTRVLGVASLLLAAGVLSPGAGNLVRGMPAVIGGGSDYPSADPGRRQEHWGPQRALAAPISAAQDGVSTRTPRELYERLVRAYEEAQEECIAALKAARTPEESEAAQKKDPDEEEFTRRFLLLAQSHPEDPVAVEALAWPFTIGCWDLGPLAEKAVDLLIKDHLPRGKFGPICRDLAFIPNRNAERLFRAALEESEDREVRGWSSFGQAQCLRIQIEEGHAADPKKALEDAERLYQKAAAEYGDLEFPEELWPNLVRRTVEAANVDNTVDSGRNTLADFAQIKLMALRAHRDLVVGKPAYEIEGEDIDGKPMKLGDHRGKVVVLFFWEENAPAKAMIPHLRGLVRRMDGKPFILLGIAHDRDREAFKAMMAKEGINWRSWWDGDHIEGPIATRWSIRGWPTIDVLDHRGVIRYKDIEGKPLDTAVDTLLKEREASKPGQSDGRG
jgi:RNA polymerase sigma factor (sigma-70 family)